MPSNKQQKRTFLLVLLILGMGFLSFMGWLRLYGAVAGWVWMYLMAVHPGPLYIAIGGTSLGLAGLAALLGLWFRRQWGPMLARIVITGFISWYWLDYLFFTHSPDYSASVVFRLAISAAGLAYTYIVLALPAQRRYFNESK